MTTGERVKYYREQRKLSQEFISTQLGLNQSQYSRRESGAMKFNTEEIIQLAKVLEIEITDLLSEAPVFHINNQQGGNYSHNVFSPEELIKQYEKRIEDKDAVIALLTKQIEVLQGLVAK